MILHGRVDGWRKMTTKNGQSGKLAVHLKIIFSGGFVSWVQYCPDAGIDTIPPNGALAVCSLSNSTLKFVSATWDMTESAAAQGEMIIYSQDATGRKAVIGLKTDGTIEFNGNSKHLVTWQELQTALTSLCATLTAHVHPSNGAVSPGLASLACDISSAKTATLKTGG